MLTITPQMKIFLACEPVDFRCGIDRLAAICRQRLQVEPLDGALFLFCNKRRNALKILNFDGTGFWLFYKRFSRQQIKWWPTEDTSTLSAREIQVLLWQGDPSSADYVQEWRRLPQPTCSPNLDL